MLFPTQKSCLDFNQKDGFTKLQAREKACQDKLNEDTAGLEYILTIAIGARVMLQCNMLDNGAIGTVLAITSVLQ